MAVSSEFKPPSADFMTKITRSQRTLHGFIVSMVRNAADADDILQETNIVLWQKAGEFDPTRDFLPWAIRVAQLQSMAYFKTKQRDRLAFNEELLALVADEAVAESAEADLRRVALSACLQKLSEPQRTLIARRYQPGGSVNEIARERGTTPKALSEMLRRIRTSLLLCIERTLEREFGV